MTDRVASFFVGAWDENPIPLTKLALTLQHQGLVPEDLDGDRGRDAIYAVAVTLPNAANAATRTVILMRLEPPWRHVVLAAERQIDLNARQRSKRD